MTTNPDHAVANRIQAYADNFGEAEAVLEPLIKGYPIPLKDGFWLGLGGNGSGYWITQYFDTQGLKVGSSQGCVYPKDQAKACLELNAQRIDFERQKLLALNQESLPNWCTLSYSTATIKGE